MDLLDQLTAGTSAYAANLDIFDDIKTDVDTITTTVKTDIDKVNTKLDETSDLVNTSITKFIKKMMVISRVYIQNSIVDDPALDPNLISIQNQYLAFILTALQMNAYIGPNSTVKRFTRVVATEKYTPFASLVDDSFGSIYDSTGLEASNSNPTNKNTSAPSKPVNNVFRSSTEERPKDLSLSTGRIIDVLVGGHSIKIPVQLVPMILPNEVAEQFVSMNFTPSLRQRWMQFTTGEISFFKDLVFQCDMRQKKIEALKKDKSGVLYDMLRQQNRAQFKYEEKIRTKKNTQNIANSIFIFEKQSFLRYANNAGLNWKLFANRERFFDSTFSFMLVLIDPIYGKSEHYWSGFDAVGEYSLKQLQAASKKESYDLRDIMAAFSQGHSPRF